MASDLCQTWVVWQCGHRTELPVSTDRRNDSGSIDIPVLTGSPVVGHVIEIAATLVLLADRLRLAGLSTTHNLSAQTSPDRRAVLTATSPRCRSRRARLAGVHDAVEVDVEVEVASAGPRGRPFGDVEASFALRALPGPYLPWGSGSMRPSGLVEVCNDVVLNDRCNIVELGSGVSTVILARLLAQRAGTADRSVVAVEHDARWRRWVVGQLIAEGLDVDVTVVDAPLRPFVGGGGLAWYDETAIDAAIDVIDLLVVDGPPAFEPGYGLARHRALVVLRERLVAGATVVLDDVERVGEQDVLRRWEDEFGLEFRRHVHAGVAIATIP